MDIPADVLVFKELSVGILFSDDLAARRTCMASPGASSSPSLELHSPTKLIAALSLLSAFVSPLLGVALLHGPQEVWR